MKSLKKLIAFSAFILLIGCGDNQINEITEVNRLTLDVVAKKKNLPECNSDIEGKVIWVTAEERSYACSDGDWLTYVEGNLPKDHSVECSTKELEDGSGVKVVCDGDSVGVLQYGENAGEIIPPKTTCSLRMLSSDSLKLECGKLSKLLSIDDLLDSLGESYEVVMDSEQVAVRLENIGGYSQKGPFLTGSEVVAYEIENGRTMKQTGTKFEGRILNDDGSFNIRSVKLASQYGFVSVNGFYLNEVSGGVSNARITLNAVTDFRNRNMVNVNVLTQMEYERILHLVTKEKYRFAEAKKKVESEIWKIFRIDDSKFLDDAEDLNIAGSGDGDAALLAMSILLQRDGDAADLLSLVTDIGNAISDSGVWKNDSLEAAIADWSMEADVSGKYEKIKEHVAGWGLSVKVADFEPYLRNYWQSVLEVPVCTDDNDGSIAPVLNKRSAYYSTDGLKIFLKCDASEHRWVALSDEGADILNWNDSLDGTLKPGNYRTDVIYVFDSTGAYDGKKGWRRTMSAVERAYGGCRKEVYGDTVNLKGFGKSYVCDEKSHLWKGTASLPVIDVSIWPKGSDGDIRWNEDHSECEVFDEKYGGWRRGHELDCNLDLMGCTSNRVGEIAYSNITGSYKRCDFHSGNYLEYASVEHLTEESCKLFCDSFHIYGRDHEGCYVGEMDIYNYYSTVMTYSLFDVDKEFIRNLEMGIVDDSLYEKTYEVCLAYVQFPVWYDFSEEEADRYGRDCDGRETFWGLVNPDNLYACKDSVMTIVSDMEKALGQLCYKSVAGTLTPNSRYVCKDTATSIYRQGYDWRIATVFDVPRGAVNYFNEELDYGELLDSRDGKTYKTVYIEGSGTWMAENLNFRDGQEYFYLRNKNSCAPSDDSLCSHLGTIYEWSAAMNIDGKWNYETASKIEGLIGAPHQGICPDGWHVPTGEEWLDLVHVYQPDIKTLFEAHNGVNTSRFQARNINEWPNSTNESGLTILPFQKVVTVQYKGGKPYESIFYKTYLISANTTSVVVSDSLMYFGDESSRHGFVRCKKDDPVE